MTLKKKTTYKNHQSYAQVADDVGAPTRLQPDCNGREWNIRFYEEHAKELKHAFRHTDN